MFSKIVACIYNVCKGPKSTRRRGLTLMEVIIAALLLGCAIPPVLRALSDVYVYSPKFERKTQGSVFAQAKLDERRARSIYNFGSAGSLAQSDVPMGGSYYCNVTDVDAGTNLRLLTVTAGYDQDGDHSLDDNEIEVTLATYIARRW
jgi:hypothetical protein